MTLGYLCLGFGVYFIPVVLNQIFFNTAPFWLALMSYFILGESLSLFQTVAMFLSFGCIIIIVTAKPLD